jgi:hypothetical protein
MVFASVRLPGVLRLLRTALAKELVAVGLRFNPPPGWPVPAGFTPAPGWQPEPSWPPPPPGWQLWVGDDYPPADTMPIQAIQAGPPSAPPLPGYDVGNQFSGTGAPYGDTGTPYGGAGAPYGGTGTPPYGGTGTPPYGGTGTPPYGGAPYGSAGSPYGVPDGVTRPPGSGKMSGWAVASFILGLLSVFILGVIFGFIALSRIKRLGQRGRGLAIAGLVLSGVWIVIIILAVIGANVGKATRSSAGVITHSGRINVFSLSIGDCFDNPAGAQTVNTVTAIPCNQPHNAQIYGKFKLTGSDLSYPGATAVAQAARSGCNARIGNVNKSMTTSAMTVRIFLPEERAWIIGQRTVSCMIVNPKADLTSSLLNSSPATG